MAIYPSRERGLTFISFLLLMGLIGFFTLLIVKIGPVYLDHYKVVASLAALKSDKDLVTRTKGEIIRALEKHWEIDMIDSFLSKDNVVITNDGNQLKVQVTYDVAKPILGNVDAVMHFDDSIEVSSH
jgi:hypothetical protein